MAKKDCVKQLTGVAGYVQKLVDKYGYYANFKYCCGVVDSEKKGTLYEKWRFYTPIIGCKEFETSRDLISFVKELLRGDIRDQYLNL